MSADSEALAGNWFAVPNTFHQAVADNGVLVLSCAEHASRGLRRRCRATSSGPQWPRLSQLGSTRAPTIVSVTVRELDFLSSLAARLAWLAGTNAPWPAPGAAMRWTLSGAAKGQPWNPGLQGWQLFTACPTGPTMPARVLCERSSVLLAVALALGPVRAAARPGPAYSRTGQGFPQRWCRNGDHSYLT